MITCLLLPYLTRRVLLQFYLPKGKWTDIQTGRGSTRAASSTSTKHDYFSLPHAVLSPNSIIAYGNFERDFVIRLCRGCAKLVIYQLEDGKQAECKVYDSEGKLAQRIVAEREGDEIFVTADAKHLPFTCEATNGCKVIVK